MPGRERLDDRQRVVRERRSRAPPAARRRSPTRDDPDRRAQPRRLDEHRQAQRRPARRSAASRPEAHSAPAAPGSRPAASPARAISSLNVDLVHAQRPRRARRRRRTARRGISSSPWTVPSSPNGPCRTGNTTSRAEQPAGRATATPRRRRSRHAPSRSDLDRDDLVAAVAQPVADRRGGGERDVVLGRAAAAEHARRVRGLTDVVARRGRRCVGVVGVVGVVVVGGVNVPTMIVHRACPCSLRRRAARVLWRRRSRPCSAWSPAWSSGRP